MLAAQIEVVAGTFFVRKIREEGLIKDNLKMCIFSPPSHLSLPKEGEKPIELYQLMDFRPRELLLSTPRRKSQSNMKDGSQPLTATLILDSTNPNDICAQPGRIGEGSDYIRTTTANMARVNLGFLHCPSVYVDNCAQNTSG